MLAGQWVDAAQVKGLFTPQQTATKPPPAPVERAPANIQPAEPPVEPPAVTARALPSSKRRSNKKTAAIVAATVTGLLTIGAIAVVLLGRSNAPQQGAAILTATPSPSKAAVTPSETTPSPSEDAPAATRPPVAENPLSTEEVVARCEGAVALIIGKHSSGTGFLAQPNLVVTNKHVIADESVDSIKVYPGGTAVDQIQPNRATAAFRARTLRIARILNSRESLLDDLVWARDNPFLENTVSDVRRLGREKTSRASVHSDARLDTCSPRHSTRRNRRG